MPLTRASERPRRVGLFRNGRNQALRIPRDLELPGREAVIHREGRRLVVEPTARPSLLEVLGKLKPLDRGLPLIERPAPRAGRPVTWRRDRICWTPASSPN